MAVKNPGGLFNRGDVRDSPFLNRDVNHYTKYVKWASNFLALVILGFYRIYARTFRVVFINDSVFRKRPPDRSPLIMAHWHENDLALLYPHSWLGLNLLISLSRDGEKMAYVTERLGYDVHRGSSSRGGARGLINLIRSVEAGGDAVLAIDGPRGPRHVVKPGIAMLALKSGASILPVAATARSRFVFDGTWSKMYLPRLFTKVYIQYDRRIIPPPASNDPAELELCRVQVEQALIRLNREVVAACDADR
jgi:lysophospholipid acyltransferase (LPLAT)-like uncharacterized protein